MKAFSESRRALARRTGLILLFAEKLAAQERAFAILCGSRDEHSQMDILTPGLTSLPPSRSVPAQWQWEFVARYSGATVPEFHGVPSHLADFKELLIWYDKDGVLPRKILCFRRIRSGNVCRARVYPPARRKHRGERKPTQKSE